MTRAVFKAMMLIIQVFLLFESSPAGRKLADDTDLAELFERRNAEGTIIISSLDGSTEYIHNRARSEKQYLPASTFKILNTLIAFDEGAIADEKAIIRWDGRDRGWDPWNKDHSLETAFPLSCVWFYQELARRIGNEMYLSHLKKVQYGNEKTGPEVTTFWLEGNIKISGREQIEFLKKLYKEELPYKSQHLQILKKIMIVEQTEDYTIRAKTGWAMRIDRPHGWYVGYVETKEQVWFFATNIRIEQESDAAKRKAITMEALAVKGIL